MFHTCPEMISPKTLLEQSPPSTSHKPAAAAVRLRLGAAVVLVALSNGWGLRTKRIRLNKSFCYSKSVNNFPTSIRHQILRRKQAEAEAKAREEYVFVSLFNARGHIFI
jgi:hypothetical protein